MKFIISIMGWLLQAISLGYGLKYHATSPMLYWWITIGGLFLGEGLKLIGELTDLKNKKRFGSHKQVSTELSLTDSDTDRTAFIAWGLTTATLGVKAAFGTAGSGAALLGFTYLLAAIINDFSK